MQPRILALTLWLAIMAALSGLAGAPARVGAQDQSPFTIDVRAGYEGAYRLGDWFPVTIDIGNDGADVRGVLEWNFPGHTNEQTFRRAIELPRGSRKRVTFEVFAHGLARNGQVRLLADDTPLLVKDVVLDAIDDSRFLIGVVSSDPALLNSLNSVQVAAFNGAEVRHLVAADLSERVAGLRGLNALFLHDIDSGTLTPGQRAALALWISLGGQLVVSGGIAGQQAGAGLADLLPADLGGQIVQGDLAPLAGLAGVNERPPIANAPLTQAQPRAGAEQLPAGSALLFRQAYGAGMVLYCAFDLASLRGWTGETSLWGELLSWINPIAANAGARMNQVNLLQSVLRLRPLGLPSAGALLLFLLAYMLVIGPLNYVVLRRMQRLEWAWFTIPLVVLIFSGGLYVVGFGLRGGRAQLYQVAVVQGAEGQPRGFATAFVGLFSPRRASYSLEFPADTLVSEIRGWSEGSSQYATVVTDDTGAASTNVLVDIASVRTFVSEAAVDLPLSIESDLSVDNAGVRGAIRNSGTSQLEDVLLLQGDLFMQIGTLSPGASQQVEPRNMRTGFPFAANLSEVGLINRQQMLTTIYNNDIIPLRNPNSSSSAAGQNDTAGVYLLAWSSQPTLGARVNGQEPPQNGVTLYVIRLRPR